MGGGFIVLPVTILTLGILVRGITLTGTLPVAGLGLLVLILSLVFLPRLPVIRELGRDDRMIQEFLRVSHPISLAVVAFLGSLLIVVLLVYAPVILTLLLFTAITFLILAGLGTQSGRIDLKERILTYSHGTGETALELNYLTDASRWTIGEQTVFRVKVTREGGPWRTHFLVLPTADADQATEVFEACLTTPTGSDRPDRTTYNAAIAGALIGGGITVGLVTLLVWANASFEVIGLVVVGFGGISSLLWSLRHEY